MNPQQRPDAPVKQEVLLMFENHSFDQMLGCFKPEADRFCLRPCIRYLFISARIPSVIASILCPP